MLLEPLLTIGPPGVVMLLEPLLTIAPPGCPGAFG